MINITFKIFRQNFNHNRKNNRQTNHKKIVIKTDIAQIVIAQIEQSVIIAFVGDVPIFFLVQVDVGDGAGDASAGKGEILVIFGRGLRLFFVDFRRGENVFVEIVDLEID